MKSSLTIYIIETLHFSSLHGTKILHSEKIFFIRCQDGEFLILTRHERWNILWKILEIINISIASTYISLLSPFPFLTDERTMSRNCSLITSHIILKCIAFFWFSQILLIQEYISFQETTRSRSLSLIYVIRRGLCSPSTWVSIGGQCCVSDGPQSCKFPLLASLCVKRCAMEKPPLPSNCVNTIITCLEANINLTSSSSCSFAVKPTYEVAEHCRQFSAVLL